MKRKSDPSLDAAARASVYQDIGSFNCEVGTKCCLEKAKKYMEKARDIIIASGMCECECNCLLRHSKVTSKKMEAMLRGESPKQIAVDEISSFRARYDYLLQSNGECSLDTIQSGIDLAELLLMAHHTIEAVRLLETLVATSRRVHASDHKETKDVVLLLQRMQMRCVYHDVQPRGYQALRYENDGKKCVIQGPINEPRVTKKEATFTVPSTDIRVAFGTPVVLHGLKKAAHLNGKMGDVRDYCQSTDRLFVYLEDKELKPVKVKHMNLRIVFDLPDPKNLG